MRSLIAVLSMTAVSLATADGSGSIRLGARHDITTVPLSAVAFLSESSAKFERVPNTWSWVSDVEHVVEKSQRRQVFLADGTPRYTLTDDVVPAGREFELMPYHYYDVWEEKQLGGRINYRMYAENLSTQALTLEISGAGTTRSWNHDEAWGAALAGKGARTVTLEPGAQETLWEERRLEGGLPWSGIFLGRASGNLRVVCYAYLGERDPGTSGAVQMPDLAWPPYNLGSFNRGRADWNAARIELFTDRMGSDGFVPLSKLGTQPHGIAVAYSEGGPPTNPCYYKAVQPTFVRDTMLLRDPVSTSSHAFLGGIYTAMYRFRLPLHNDTSSTRRLDFCVAANDVFKVGAFVGVWINQTFLSNTVAPVGKGAYWVPFSVTIRPGEKAQPAWTLIPLGGKWGGVVAVLRVQEVAP